MLRTGTYTWRERNRKHQSTASLAEQLKLGPDQTRPGLSDTQECADVDGNIISQVEKVDNILEVFS